MSKLQEIVDAFPKKTVLIVGDAMLDEYIWGDVQRISPEAPVPVVVVTRRTFAPGGAANVAANVAGLGGRVMLGGVVGTDPQAEQLRNVLRQHGVEVEGLIADPERPTTVKTRIVAHSQHVVRVDAETRDTISSHLEDQILQWVEGYLPNTDVCVISDYAKGLVSPRLARELIAMARNANIPVIVDPKTNDLTKYRGATLITPNLNETQQAAGVAIADEATLLAAGQKLLSELNGTALLITRGAQGMSLFVKGQLPVHVAAEAREVFDVTGAGDTALVTVALSLAAGASMEEAMRLANKAAGIVVGKVGTATVSVEELQNKI
jgi:D-beta-D-heptose 7-phosphate kinase/D-beta-D-heptose 1-phosphate adenosyltransferase